jgi:hypothetical protein
MAALTSDGGGSGRDSGSAPVTPWTRRRVDEMNKKMGDLLVCSTWSGASSDGGAEWMETSGSGDPPASTYGSSRDPAVRRKG